jgi:hypothetical protein
VGLLDQAWYVSALADCDISESKRNPTPACRQRNRQSAIRSSDRVGYGRPDLRLVSNPGRREPLEHTLVGFSQRWSLLRHLLLVDYSSSLLYQRAFSRDTTPDWQADKI